MKKKYKLRKEIKVLIYLILLYVSILGAIDLYIYRINSIEQNKNIEVVK